MKSIMKILLSLCFAMLTMAIVKVEASEVSETNVLREVLSPDHHMQVKIKLENGKLYYQVFYKAETILDWSMLGLDTSNGQFYQGLEWRGEELTKINEEFSMKTGKRPVYQDHCKKYIITLQNPDKKELKVIFKVYDDGVAYRYGIEEELPFQVLMEKGTFVMPTNIKRYFAMDYLHYYEGFYNERYENLEGDFAFPLLYQLHSGTYGLLAQAELTGDYNGRMLHGDGSSTYTLKAVYKRTEDNKKALKDLDVPTVPANFLSPWRALIVGDEENIFQTEMIEALNPPTALESTEWIKPGTSGWSWWNGDKTDDFHTYKSYVDYCGAMDYPYMLLDAGWQKLLEENTFGELKEYADEKGVGLIVWSHQQDLDTPDELIKLEEWAALGIKGIKVDFFDSEEQKRIKLYDTILKKAAELELLVNFHGSNAPSGMRRTYPHLVTAEGIRGAEYTKLFFDKAPTAKHNVTVPFTRNAIGPMDYTPVTYSDTDGKYTFAHSTALPVVFESGLTCIADKPWQILVSHAFTFLKGMPSTWDESLMLEGQVGKYISVARKSEATWYIGAICNEGREAVLDLQFLDEGNVYLAEIIEDGPGYSLKNRLQEVTKDTTLRIPLREHGGVAIKLTKKETLPDVQWQVIRRDHFFVPLGAYEAVKIDNTEVGDLYRDSNNMRNLALMDVTSEDFTVTTKVYFEPNKRYQKAGILIYKDDDHYVSVQKAYHPTWGGNSFAMSTEDDEDYDESGITNLGQYTNYLKLEKEGNTFRGYWSEDGENWNLVKEYINEGVNTGLKIGFFASNGTEKYWSSERDAVFSQFTLDGITIPLIFD